MAPTIKELVARLRGDDPEGWQEAARDASKLGKSKSAVKAVCGVLAEGTHEMQRWWAGYILGYAWDDPLAGKRLFEVLQDTDETPLVRGIAAEHLSHFEESVGRRKMIAAYTNGLDDPSPIVRFWCVFGLMQVRAKIARARLLTLAANDDAECPGWSKVSTEAKLALAMMDGLALSERLWPGPFRLPPQLPNPTRTAFLQHAVKLRGALIVRGKEIIAESEDRREPHVDPTAVAEVLAIREAGRILQTFDLSGCEIYCATEPDTMTLGAIYWARLKRIYYASPRTPASSGVPEVPTRNLLRRQGRAPFDAWAKSAGKIPY